MVQQFDKTQFLKMVVERFSIFPGSNIATYIFGDIGSIYLCIYAVRILGVSKNYFSTAITQELSLKLF